MKSLLTILTFVLCTRDCKANDSLLIIQPSVKKLNPKTDCTLVYKLVSKSKDTVNLVRYLYITDWNNQASEVWIWLERKENNGYVRAAYSDSPPPMIPADESQTFISLLTNDSIPIVINLCHKYKDLKEGEYRMKILVRASVTNEMDDVVTDWFYFKIDED